MAPGNVGPLPSSPILPTKGSHERRLTLAQKRIEPLFGRILVRPVEIDWTEVERHIITPDIAQDQPEFGQVVAAAADCEVIREGDLVMFGKYSGYGVNDDEFINLREKDVMARLHGYKTRERKNRDAAPAAAEQARIIQS